MIGIGIAGAGHFAAQHARALQALPEFRIAAVSAHTAERSASFAAQHGGRPVAQWQDLLTDPEVQVILITMPHHLHAEVAIAAGRAGKHVLLEKPMALSPGECRAITTACARVHLLVGQIMRFVRPCLAARDLLRSGRLGRPRFGRTMLLKLWMESNRQPWHLAPENGGGMLYTAGIHALDRLVWLMDAPVESVAAMSATLFHPQRVADTDQLLLRFAGGGLGQVASVATADPTMLNTTEIICEHGTLVLDLDTGLRIARAGTWETIEDAMEPDWALRGLQREWQALLAAIQTGTPPEVSGDAGGQLVAIITAAQHAAATAQTTPVEW